MGAKHWTVTRPTQSYVSDLLISCALFRIALQNYTHKSARGLVPPLGELLETMEAMLAIIKDLGSTLDIMVVVNIIKVLLGLRNTVVVVGKLITKDQAGLLGTMVVAVIIRVQVGHLVMVVVAIRVLDSIREEQHP